MAEQERLTIRKRQRQGIEAAKAKGKHLGRPYNLLPKNATVIIDILFIKKTDQELQYGRYHGVIKI